MTESRQVGTDRLPRERARPLDLLQGLGSDGGLWNGKHAAEVGLNTVDREYQVPGSEVCFTQLSIVSHTGTHVEAARHFFLSGRTIDEPLVEPNGRK